MYVYILKINILILANFLRDFPTAVMQYLRAREHANSAYKYKIYKNFNQNALL